MTAHGRECRLRVYLQTEDCSIKESVWPGRSKKTHRYCSGLGNLLRELLEFPVEQLATFAFLLLKFDFVFVTLAILPLAVSCLIKLHVGRFTEELDVLKYCEGSSSTRMAQLTCAFFFPIMMGAFRWMWMMTRSSWSQGWKKRCLTLLNRISAGGRVSHALIPYANKHTYPLSDRRHEADTVLVDLDVTR